MERSPGHALDVLSLLRRPITPLAVDQTQPQQATYCADAAVQEQDWAASVIAPFDVVEAHSAQDDVMVLGRRERAVGYARQLEAETMVLRVIREV